MTQEIHSFQLVRNINFQKGDKLSKGELVIGGITWDEKDDVWGCKARISFLHEEFVTTYGVDAIHALMLSFRFISGLIAGAEDDGIEIWWLEPGDHCGLVFGNN